MSGIHTQAIDIQAGIIWSEIKAELYSERIDLPIWRFRSIVLVFVIWFDLYVLMNRK